MRLQYIKLAGFKSFVDPTTVPFPKPLTAIVGPNGCGKSNIIDAVRWVMGESSAKQLRGESLADVIFNGSSARKPVGQASIELVFDNSDGTVGGQYAKYSQIAIKRLLSRDGQSQYFINNTKCRRRDITDIFLGTGLGPRSYAIIEQGMISRIIESKPEELRVFIEEAAGTSKYKERRRETENRIRHTRDNLDRLTDLREELEKQLNHLERQAKAAERYKVLKEEERMLKAQLNVLRIQALQERQTNENQRLRELETGLEAKQAERQHVDTAIEKQLDRQTELHDEFNEVQSRYYKVGAEIARLEQSIQHSRDREQMLQDELGKAQLAQNELSEHKSFDLRQQESLQAMITELEPQHEALRAAVDASQSALHAADQAMHDWQFEWDTFNKHTSELSERVQVTQTRIQHLEQQLQQASQRLAELNEQAASINLNEFVTALREQQASLAEQENKNATLKTDFQATQAALTAQRSENQQLTGQLSEARDQLQTLHGRYASLEALQQQALGQDDDAFNAWLGQHNLADKPRLAQTLSVESGWEHALEVVLGEHLEAICLNNLSELTGLFADVPSGQFNAVTHHSTAAASSANTLASKVQAEWYLPAQLNKILVADDLAAAQQLLAQLADGQSVITKDGVWLARDWVRVVKPVDEQTGVLRREQQLKTLRDEITTVESTVSTLQNQLTQGEEALLAHEAERDRLQQALNECAQAIANGQAALKVVQERESQAQRQSEKITTELTTLAAQQTELNDKLTAERASFQQANDQLASTEQRRESLSALRDEYRESLEAAREKARTDKDAGHDVTLRLETARTQLEATQRNNDRINKQLDDLQSRTQELQTQIETLKSPVVEMQSQLDGQLEQRLNVEQNLTAVRQRVGEAEHNLRELEVKRGQMEQTVSDQRSKLEKQRMDMQALTMRAETLLENLAELELTFEAVQQAMPEEASETAWQEALEATARRIQRLGAINLAAIDEHKEVAERKTYLDDQHADLIEALTTLENAINKIDKETRARFKETYDTVNENLQNLFPRLFGGGQARLELVGEEDLLTAGVAMMARPPGKRVSSIHQLSGGEKALSAVSLVFAIFQLNPAPFCMLDEVDAPLDDANVGRFCNLVREMSQDVQFIYISHNKLTIEMADNLAGVTMNEPGVSRMVAVDVAEALEMAEA